MSGRDTLSAANIPQILCLCLFSLSLLIAGLWNNFKKNSNLGMNAGQVPDEIPIGNPV
jgi:hypothetical protein